MQSYNMIGLVSSYCLQNNSNWWPLCNAESAYQCYSTCISCCCYNLIVNAFLQLNTLAFFYCSDTNSNMAVFLHQNLPLHCWVKPLKRFFNPIRQKYIIKWLKKLPNINHHLFYILFCTIFSFCLIYWVGNFPITYWAMWSRDHVFPDFCVK